MKGRFPNLGLHPLLKPWAPSMGEQVLALPWMVSASMKASFLTIRPGSVVAALPEARGHPKRHSYPAAVNSQRRQGRLHRNLKLIMSLHSPLDFLIPSCCFLVFDLGESGS